MREPALQGHDQQEQTGTSSEAISLENNREHPRPNCDTCSDWKKNFLSRDSPPPLVKGKLFDTRFGLIHVQTGKKIFCQGTPPVRGKFFDTRFGLIHVQTGKKIFHRGTAPSPSTAKMF